MEYNKKWHNVTALAMMLGQVVSPTIVGATEVLSNQGSTGLENIAEEEPEEKAAVTEDNDVGTPVEELRDSNGNVTLKDADVNVEGGIIEGLTDVGNQKLQGKVNILKFATSSSTIGIGEGIFREKEINEIQVNSHINIVGDKAFEGSGVTKVSFSNPAVTVGAYAFADNGLTSIDLSNVTSIGEYAFQDNNLEEVNTKGVQVIPAGAFSNNSIGSLVIEEGTVEVGKSAFSGNIIKEVALADSVTTLGEGVFNDNGQVVKVLSNTVTGAELSEDHFGYVINPREVAVRYVDETTNEDIIPSEILGTDLSDVNNIFGDGETVTLQAKQVKGYVAKQETVTKLIGGTNEVVFSYEKDANMLEVNIPDKNVIAGSYVGEYTLREGIEILDSKGNGVTSEYMSSVKFTPNRIDTSVPGAVTVIATVDKNGKTGSTTFKVIVGEDNCDLPIGNGWTVCDFSYYQSELTGFSKQGEMKIAKGNTDVVLPGVTKDGDPITSIFSLSSSRGAFSGKGITSVDFSNCTDLQKIYPKSFEGNNITQVDLSMCKNLRIIDEDSFAGNSISKVNLHGNTQLEEINTMAFRNNNITSLDLSGCPKLKTIGHYAFEGNNLSSLNLSGCASLEVIQYSAFQDCALTELDLSGCVKLQKIEQGAFSGNNLTSVNFTGCNNLKEIKPGAFKDNDLTEVDFSGCANLQKIRYSVFKNNKIVSVNFSGCSNLKELSGFSGNYLTSLNLSDCESLLQISGFSDNQLTSVDLRGCSNLQKIESEAFKNNNLTSLDLSGCTNLQEIGWGAFKDNDIASLDLSGCTNLQKIGNNAFKNNNLTELDLSGCTSLQEIQYGAFHANEIYSLDLSGCVNLQVIGNSYNFDGAFERNKLTSVDFSKCGKLSIIGKNSFRYNKIATLDLSMCTSLQYIGDNAFRAWPNSPELQSNDLSKLTELHTIGEDAFEVHASESNPLKISSSVQEFDLRLPTGAVVTTTAGNNPNNITCGSGCEVDPAKVTIIVKDRKTGKILADKRVQLMPKGKKNKVVLPYIKGYVYNDSIEFTPTKYIEELVVYLDKETDFSLASKVSISNKVVGKSHEEIGNYLRTDVGIATSSTVSGLGKSTLRVLYDSNYINKDRIKVAPGTTYSFTIKDGYIDITFNNSNLNSFNNNIPILWAFKKGVTPNNQQAEITAVLLKDNKQIVPAQVQYISGYYTLPILVKTPTPYEGGRAYYEEVGDNTKNITYYIKVKNLERNLQGYTLTDELPEYLNRDGDLVKATFNPELNAGWVLSQDGNSVEYTGPVTRWGSFSVPLVLTYTNADVNHKITNTATINMEPQDKGEFEENFILADSTYHYVGVLPRPVEGEIFNLWDNGPRGNYDHTYFYDTDFDRNKVLDYDYYMQNPKDYPMQEAIIYSDNLDSRSYYTGFTINGKGLEVIATALDKKGNTLATNIVKSGNSIEYTEEIGRKVNTIKYEIVGGLLPANNDKGKSNNIFINVHTKLRKPSVDNIIETGNRINDKLPIRMRVEFTYHGVTQTGSETDTMLMVKPPRDVVAPTKQLYVNGSLSGVQNSIAIMDRNADISYKLGVEYKDPTTEEGKLPFLYGLDAFKYVDLLPNDLTFVSFDLNKDLVRDGITYEVVNNYKNTGQTALVISGDMTYNIGKRTVDLGTLHTVLSNNGKVDRFVNDAYLSVNNTNTDLSNPEYISKLKGTYSHVDSVGRAALSEELFTRKFIRENSSKQWIMGGIELSANKSFEYKLETNNLTRKEVNNVSIIDVLPYANDNVIQYGNDGNRISRGSEFTPLYDRAKRVTTKNIANARVYYYNASNEDWNYGSKTTEQYLDSRNWSTQPSSTTRAIKVTGTKINKFTTAEVIVPMEMPGNISEIAGKVAYNTFVRKDSTTSEYLECNPVYVKGKTVYGTISLTKTDEKGNKMQGVTFELHGDNGSYQTATTNRNGVATFTHVAIDNYTLKEQAVDGYTLVNDAKGLKISKEDLTSAFSGSTFNYNYGTIQNEFNPEGHETTGTIRLKKVGATGKGLSSVVFNIQGLSDARTKQITSPTGASYTVTIPSNKHVNRKVVSGTDGMVIIPDLIEGKYRITEERSKNSLVATMEPKEVTVTSKQDVVINAGTVVNDKAQVRLYKVGLTEDVFSNDYVHMTGMDGEEVGNVEFKVTKANGQLHANLKTNGAGFVDIKDLNVNEVYTITEVSTPEPYELNPLKAKFKVDENGILRAENNERFILMDTIYFPNKKVTQNSTVVITKQDDNGNNLQGAEFTLYKKDENKNYQKVVTKATNNLGKVTFEVEGGQVYKVAETKAPKGYHNNNWKAEFVAEQYKSKTFSYLVTNPELNLKVRKVEILGKNLTKSQADQLQLSKGGVVELSQEKQNKFNVVKPLANAEFNLYEKGKTNLIAKLKSDVNGYIYYNGNSLEDNKTYYLKEVKAPTGYALSDELKYFTPVTFGMLDDNFDGTIEFNFINKKLTGSVSVSKYNRVTGDIVKGAEFTLTNKATGQVTKQVTDNYGNVYFNELNLGSYTVTESNPAEGYTATNWSKTFKITENNLIFQYEVYNDPEVKNYNYEFIKVDGKTKTPLSGVLFSLYDATTGKLLESNITSNDKGIVTLTDLDPSVTYLVKETKTLEGYNLSNEELTITYNKKYTEKDYWQTAKHYEFNNYKRNEEPMPATGTHGILLAVGTSVIAILGAIYINKKKHQA